ncbi:MAG: pyridoxamine 5'-phosphate oxidase family protein [Opitutaceae bacterium]
MSTRLPDSPAEKLKTWISDIRVAMFTTVAANGALHTRPMATQESSSIDEIWFFTSSHNLLTEEIDHIPQVGLSYSDPVRKRYVSISGSARILRDEAKARERWTPGVGAWFPKGPADPELRLICVTAQKAEYWDATVQRMSPIFERAKAALGGESHPPAGDHGTLDLKP